LFFNEPIKLQEDKKMLNMSLESNINSIPYLLYMEEQEQKEKERQQLAEEDTNRRDHEQSEDKPL
jgi:hypothetical protein